MSERLEKEFDSEIHLRGSALDVAIKFETVLMSIVYFSNSEQYVKPSESPTLRIRNLTFSGKIKRVKEILTKYHPDLLSQYDNLFSDLDKFLDLRNKLAHCAIAWLDDNCDEMEIWDVQEHVHNFQFYAPMKTTRYEMARSLAFYFSKISVPLIALHNEVLSRLKQTDPKLCSVLSSALDSDLEK